MKLKTYTAPTMAQALAQVRKDLGPDAVIVHTRSYRTGSWFGLGGRAVVEITASSAEPDAANRPAQRPRRKRNAHTTPGTGENGAAEHAAARDNDRAALFGTDARTQSWTPRAEPMPNGHAEEPPVIEVPRRSRVAAGTRDEPGARGELGAEARGGAGGASKPAPSDHRSSALDDPDPDPDPDPEPKPEPGDRASVGDGPVGAAPGDPRAAPASRDELTDKIDALERMMSRVLETTRRTDHALGAGVSSAAPDALGRIHAALVDNDVPIGVADALVHAARAGLDADELDDPETAERALLARLASSIETIGSIAASPADDAASRGVVALIGPTGVGKTTTVAKLAARAKLRAGRRVGLVTSDTYRIGAVEQLRTYADIVGLDLKIANTPEEMRRSIDELDACDLVVLDTAGRSQHNAARLDELGALLEAAAPTETHLVLSSTVSSGVLASSAERFRALGPDRCIMTKLDECVSTGLLACVGELVELPIAFVTLGQEVPDDLRVARGDRLARLILRGPAALGTADGGES